MGFPPHLDYLKEKEIVWFNPCWGFFGFWKKFNDFQEEKNLEHKVAWLHRDMKQDKEKYIAALMALFLQQTNPEKNGWWFTKTSQDPPDAIIGTPQETKKGNLMAVREIEIVEYIGQASIIETIKEKLAKKQYESNTALVCFLSPENIEHFNFKEISDELIKAQLPLQNIFVAFHGFFIKAQNKLSEAEILNEMSKVAFIQLCPYYKSFILSPQNSCKKFISGEEKAWLKFSGRGLKSGFDDAVSDNIYKLFG